MRRILLACLISVAMTATAFAQPVSARTLQIPESYGFNLEMRLNLDVQVPEMDADIGFFLALLRNAAINAEGTLVRDRESFLATHMYADVSLRAGFFHIPFSIWMDMDFRDSQNPVYLIIAELPEMLQSLIGMSSPELAKQFWVMDYAPVFEEFPEILDALDGFGMGMTFDLPDFMNWRPEMQAMGSNTYRLSLSDDEFTEHIIKSIEAGIDFAIDSVLQSMLSIEERGLLTAEEVGFLTTEEIRELELFIVREAELARAEIREELSEITEGLFDVLRRVTFLSEDWITYYVLNANGYAVSEHSTFKFVFDLAQWIDALSTVYPDLFRSEFATDAPDVVIKLGVESTITYTNINTAKRVPQTEFTPENSVNLLEM